jgi:transcription elongation factor Elf1
MRKPKAWICPICDHENRATRKVLLVKCANCLRSFQLEPDWDRPIEVIGIIQKP